MNFSGVQKTLTCKQKNTGPVEEVFPLLCPVRESDWLQGWEYTLIHSKSGLIEQDCVFSTPHHGDMDTIWYVTCYDRENYILEFLRVTPLESVVKINISLQPLGNEMTETTIVYQHTALNLKQNEYITDELSEDFRTSMEWWEKAINHYLSTGEMLEK